MNYIIGKKVNFDAALIIDMQPGFLRFHKDENVYRMIQSQKSLLKYCAENDIPAIIVEYCPDNIGETIEEIKDDFKIVPRTEKVKKLRTDGFQHTQLEYHLRRFWANNLLLAGINKSYCVKATAQSAVELGFRILTAEDSIGDIKDIPSTDTWYRKNGLYVTTIDQILDE